MNLGDSSNDRMINYKHEFYLEINKIIQKQKQKNDLKNKID